MSLGATLSIVLGGAGLALLAIRRMIAASREIQGNVGWGKAVFFLLFPPAAWFWILNHPKPSASKAERSAFRIGAFFASAYLVLSFGAFLGPFETNMTLPSAAKVLFWFSLPMVLMVIKCMKARS